MNVVTGQLISHLDLISQEFMLPISEHPCMDALMMDHTLVALLWALGMPELKEYEKSKFLQALFNLATLFRLGSWAGRLDDSTSRILPLSQYESIEIGKVRQLKYI